MLHWARLLTYSPGIDMEFLGEKDILNVALSKFDILVVPGGSSRKQYQSVGEAGGEIIRTLLRDREPVSEFVPGCLCTGSSGSFSYFAVQVLCSCSG